MIAVVVIRCLPAAVSVTVLARVTVVVVARVVLVVVTVLRRDMAGRGMARVERMAGIPRAAEAAQGFPFRQQFAELSLQLLNANS